jgi:hypothetical protein
MPGCSWHSSLPPLSLVACPRMILGTCWGPKVLPAQFRCCSDRHCLCQPCPPIHPQLGPDSTQPTTGGIRTSTSSPVLWLVRYCPWSASGGPSTPDTAFVRGRTPLAHTSPRTAGCRLLSQAQLGALTPKEVNVVSHDMFIALLGALHKRCSDMHPSAACPGNNSPSHKRCMNCKLKQLATHPVLLMRRHWVMPDLISRIA